MEKKDILELFQHGEICTKEGDIAGLKVQQGEILRVLGRMEKGQEKVADALERLASQNERINHTEQEINRLDRNDSEIFKRLNVLETEPGKKAGTFRRDVGLVLASGAMTLCITLILKAWGLKP